MAQKLLSISLGSEIVKVCEVMLAGKNRVQVFNAIDLIVPEGLCDDGMIMDANSLAYAIKEGLAGEGFSSKKIVFTLNSKRIANKEAIIPFCKPNKIKDIVTINASEYFPIGNLENYTINYSVIEIVQNESVKNYRLSITATPNELLEQYYALAAAMGMSVEFIDYSGNSILQLLKLQTAGEGVDAVLQLGGENTVVNIMNGSVMVMQRSVPYGRVAIVDAIKNSMNCSAEQADEILVTHDISRLAAQSEEIEEAVRALISSVSRILEFYATRNPERPIERSYVIGDVSSINGFVELINEETELNIEHISRLRGVEIKNRENVSEEIAANYLANIGAVLEPMNISLASDKKGLGAAQSGKMPWWILIFAGVVAAAMIGVMLYLYSKAASENETIQGEIDALGGVIELQQQFDDAQANLKIMEDWLDSTKSPNETLVKFIKDLENVQPSAVAIKSFSAQDGDVTLVCTSYGKPAAAEFLIQLKHIPYVTNVKAEYVSENIEDVSAVDAFNVTLRLEYDKPDAEPSATVYSPLEGEETEEYPGEEIEEYPIDEMESAEYSELTESDEMTEEIEGGQQ